MRLAVIGSMGGGLIAPRSGPVWERAVNKRDHAEDDAAEPRRRWQFRLIHLLLVPVALGLALDFYIAWYPYSLIALPVFVISLIGIVGLSILRGAGTRPAEAVVAGIIVYAAATILGSGFIDLGGAPRRSQCTNNLKSILIALHNYHDMYGCFPPAYVADEKGRPMHSWRVLILPFVEEQALYAQYRFDEPWNGPNNSKLAGARVLAYQCPEQGAGGTSAMTSYVAVVGPGTAWPGATSARLTDIRDGTADTLLVVEMADSGIHWMQPRDMDAATMATAVNSKSGTGISSHHRDPGWRGQRLGANVGFADGHVRFLPTGTSETTVRALVTAGGGEPIERD